MSICVVGNRVVRVEEDVRLVREASGTRLGNTFASTDTMAPQVWARIEEALVGLVCPREFWGLPNFCSTYTGEELTLENDPFDATIHTMNTEINALEQYTRRCNFEIHGLPIERNENLMSILGRVAESLAHVRAVMTPIGLYATRMAHWIETSPVGQLCAVILITTLRSWIVA
ncbi:hypothetical protein HPB52_002236 [Rhipicephalus sanguineus]|uniref:Uncharacterized protein n=1 Tax=Rhipicephalus sanguineus TaxID=34632 RepID=A0A9D4Q3V7_RHISA|nr:hypothetical protein HPB52_002236 [Rhipicephalus sanguineus]